MYKILASVVIIHIYFEVKDFQIFCFILQILVENMKFCMNEEFFTNLQKCEIKSMANCSIRLKNKNNM